MKGKRSLILSTVIVLILTLAPVNGSMLGSGLDKVVHAGMFLMLGVSIFLSFEDKVSALQALIIAAFLGLIIEVVQHYIPGRNTSIIDGIANTAGLLIAMFIFMPERMSSSKLVKTIRRWN